MLEIICFISHLSISFLKPLLVIDRKNVFYSPRYYQNWLHVFARSFYIVMYLGGRSFVKERPEESLFYITLTIYLGYKMRDARFVRGKSIKKEIDNKIKNNLKKSDYYHNLTQLFGTVGMITMFFSGVIIKEFQNWSIVLLLTNFFLGIISSEMLFRREQTTYNGN